MKIDWKSVIAIVGLMWVLASVNGCVKEGLTEEEVLQVIADKEENDRLSKTWTSWSPEWDPENNSDHLTCGYWWIQKRENGLGEEQTRENKIECEDSSITYHENPEWSIDIDVNGDGDLFDLISSWTRRYTTTQGGQWDVETIEVYRNFDYLPYSPSFGFDAGWVQYDADQPVILYGYLESNIYAQAGLTIYFAEDASGEIRIANFGTEINPVRIQNNDNVVVVINNIDHYPYVEFFD